MRTKTTSRFATAADSLDVEALLAEIEGRQTVRPRAANDVARVQHGRVMPLPMAA